LRSFNILFTSSGRRVSLIRHFKKTLGRLGIQGHVVTADLKKNAPTAFVGDFHETVPRVTAPDYLDSLREICGRHNIRLLIPLIDTELHILAAHKESFQNMGVTVLVSSVHTIELSGEKRKTYMFFKQIGVDTPEVFDPEKILNDTYAEYPFLVKPADGSSSVGVTKVKNARELEFFIDYVPNAIVQEYVQGEEYTLDVLVDFNGKVRSIVPRLRIETRAGEVSKGMTVKNPAIISAGKKVAESLPGAVGCITIQCFLNPDGKLKFFEINPRFGGGYPLSIEAGADFPRWIIEMMLGRKPRIEIDGWEDGIIMLRYDDAIFTERQRML
jgi:carbamoyl-phosphate synthase large subunit